MKVNCEVGSLQRDRTYWRAATGKSEDVTTIGAYGKDENDRSFYVSFMLPTDHGVRYKIGDVVSVEIHL